MHTSRSPDDLSGSGGAVYTVERIGSPEAAEAAELLGVSYYNVSAIIDVLGSRSDDIAFGLGLGGEQVRQAFDNACKELEEETFVQLKDEFKRAARSDIL